MKLKTENKLGEIKETKSWLFEKTIKLIHSLSG